MVQTVPSVTVQHGPDAEGKHKDTKALRKPASKTIILPAFFVSLCLPLPEKKLSRYGYEFPHASTNRRASSITGSVTGTYGTIIRSTPASTKGCSLSLISFTEVAGITGSLSI